VIPKNGKQNLVYVCSCLLIYYRHCTHSTHCKNEKHILKIIITSPEKKAKNVKRTMIKVISTNRFYSAAASHPDILFPTAANLFLADQSLGLMPYSLTY